MMPKIKHFLHGVGSVLILAPVPRATMARPDFLRGTDAQRIGGDWLRVGNHLSRAISIETGRLNKNGAPK